MTRRVLPQRRHSETFHLRWWNQDFAVTVGFYGDMVTVGEVFISGPKSGVATDGAVRDSAVLLSLAIQHGVPITTIQHAVTRNSDGSASTIVGAIVDWIVRRQPSGVT